MVILLNGTYGVGKSSVAEEMKKQLEMKKVKILDSDVLVQSNQSNIEAFANSIICGGDGIQLNVNMHFMLEILRNEMNLYINSEYICILTLSATTGKSKEAVWKYLVEREKNFLHFILEADEEEIKRRINLDQKRTDKTEHLGALKQNIDFLKNNYSDAIRIETTNKSIEDVVNEIIIKL